MFHVWWKLRAISADDGDEVFEDVLRTLLWQMPSKGYGTAAGPSDNDGTETARFTLMGVNNLLQTTLISSFCISKLNLEPS